MSVQEEECLRFFSHSPLFQGVISIVVSKPPCREVTTTDRIGQFINSTLVVRLRGQQNLRYRPRQDLMREHLLSTVESCPSEDPTRTSCFVDMDPPVREDTTLALTKEAEPQPFNNGIFAGR